MSVILYDVDTQKDFMDSDGALYVPGAENIKSAIALEIMGALQTGIQIVGSLDIHDGSEPEMQANGGPFPEHCMKGTKGSRKIRETPCEYRIINPGDYNLIKNAIDEKIPIYFSKTTYDVFSNPEFEKFINEYGVKEAIVMGVATDWCVKAAVLGMQNLGVNCTVLTNAIAGVDPEASKKALNEMETAGAELI